MQAKEGRVKPSGIPGQPVKTSGLGITELFSKARAIGILLARLTSLKVIT